MKKSMGISNGIIDNDTFFNGKLSFIVANKEANNKPPKQIE